MATPVTDPDLLAQLNADSGEPKPVTDPALLSQLNTPASGDQPGMNMGETAADVAKSGGIGLVKGGLGLAGTPGDLRELGIGLASHLGVDPETAHKAVGYLAKVPGFGVWGLPTSEEMTKGLERHTGQLYEPKTTAGHVAQTIGEFAPAVIGGPETMATKLLTRVAAPALASEAAGKLGEGTKAEPFLQVAGALAGSALAHKIALPAAVKDIVPTAEQLKDAARAGYDHPSVEAVRISPRALKGATADITADLNKDGFRSLNAPQTYGLLEELRSTANPNGTGAIADVDSVRKALNKVAGNFNNPTEQAAANKAIGKIDDFLHGLKQPDLIAGDAKQATDILNEARGNWKSAKHSETLAGKLNDADLQAAATYSGSNLDNTTRQKIKSILMNKRLSRGYTQDELGQMEDIVRGSTIGNISRKVGKLLGGGGGLAQAVVGGGAATAAYETGDPRYLALPIMGVGARKIGEMTTTRAAQKLEQNLRASAPEAQKWRQVAARINAQNPQLQPHESNLVRAIYLSPALRGLLKLDEPAQKTE